MCWELERGWGVVGGGILAFAAKHRFTFSKTLEYGMYITVLCLKSEELDYEFLFL